MNLLKKIFILPYFFYFLDYYGSSDQDRKLLNNYKNYVKIQVLKDKRNEIISWEMLRRFIKDTIEKIRNQDDEVNLL